MANPDRGGARRLTQIAAGLAGCLSLIVTTPVLAATAAATPAKAAAGTSTDPKVKLRDGQRLLQDLSDGLQIPRDEICRELAKFDCANDAFRIVLGGVEPYDVRVLEPLDHASLAGPIAFDRVALHVCTSRVTKDIAEPAKALIYKPAASKGAATRAWMDTTTVALYDRLLQRPATAAEKSEMADFYKTVSNGRTDNAAIQKDWTVLSCFAVASSLESAFY